MPSVGNCSVHPQLIALHLVELVACIGVLPGADHCPANVSLLVKVPPSHFPCKEQSESVGCGHEGPESLARGPCISVTSRSSARAVAGGSLNQRAIENGPNKQQ